jgi:hypothetical protein
MRGQSLLLAAIGMVCGLAMWWLIAAMLPTTQAATSLSVRLGLGAASLLPAVVVLAFMIAAQMAARFWQGVFDPTAGKDGPFLRVNQRVITNSVEQIVMLSPALMALAAEASPARMTQILALPLVFALARLVFWLGYLVSPMLRGPGMAASFAVTLGTLGWAIAVWIS